MYCIKTSNLKDKICGIYLLFFSESSKIYIGQSNNIRRRMYEHNNIKKNIKNKYITVVDKAIAKYGQRKEVLILEECQENLLNQREEYWIKYFNLPDKNKGYNITSGGQQNIYSFRNNNLTIEEISDIRKRRFNGERKKDVFKIYSSKIGFNTFEKIWLGTTYPQIEKEKLEKFKGKTRQEYSSEANSGERNGMSKLTNQQVRKIRQDYEKQNKSIKDLMNEYNMSRGAISAVVNYKSFKNI